MIHGTHVVVYSKDAEGTGRSFATSSAFNSIDVGYGWVIFALPNGARSTPHGTATTWTAELLPSPHGTYED